MRSRTSFYLYRRKNGRYYIGQRIEERVIWKSTGKTSRGEALKVFKESSHLIAKRSPAETLKGFAERFLVVAPSLYSSKTLEIYRRSLAGLQGVAGDSVLGDVSGEHWDRFKTERMKTLSPSSVNIELRALRAAMNTAVRWKCLDSNPFSRLKVVTVPEALPTYFSKSDFVKLTQSCNEQVYRDIFLFAALTGCRRAEIINLRWIDCDCERDAITIQNSQAFKTKTRRLRILPMHLLVKEMLLRRLTESSGESVFVQNGQPITGNNLSRRLRHCVKEAGLDRALHFHSLRHSFASWLIQSGESLYTVQMLLGHTTPRMTQIYSHLEQKNLHASVERITL
jgi:integrase